MLLNAPSNQMWPSGILRYAVFVAWLVGGSIRLLLVLTSTTIEVKLTVASPSLLLYHRRNVTRSSYHFLSLIRYLSSFPTPAHSPSLAISFNIVPPLLTFSTSFSLPSSTS
eukprot:GHVU01129305.1.p1 GENE.GHVU01129305.1~~GHVU01129305.1.p1  ORF type:complete len:111 (+),score=2.00 GHVU01129305.1:934-1266(+)